MGILLSGLLGALFATILNIFYLYISGQKKLRYEVFLEIVGYWDDISEKVMEMSMLSEFVVSDRVDDVGVRDYNIVNKELHRLMSKLSPRYKIKLVYGKIDAINIYDELWDETKKLVTILRESVDIGHWTATNKALIQSYIKLNSALRAYLLVMLLNDTRVSSILIQTFKTIIVNIFDYYNNLKNLFFKCKH